MEGWETVKQEILFIFERMVNNVEHLELCREHFVIGNPEHLTFTSHEDLELCQSTRLTFFIPVNQTRFPLVTSFILGSEMRLAQMGCATGVGKNSRRAPRSRNELWSCAGEIHIFSRSRGRNLGWCYWHSKAIYLQWLCANEGVICGLICIHENMFCSGIPCNKCIYIFCKMTQRQGLYYALKWGLW